MTLPGGLLVSGPQGTPVVFHVAFSAWGVLTAVQPPLTTGMLGTLGTAPGARQVVVSGGPAEYTVTVTGMLGDGTVGIRVPGAVVSDGWGSGNAASSNEDVAAYTFTVPPSFSSANTTTFSTGALGAFHVTAAGNPAPTLTLTVALPSGITFNAASGILGGTPASATGGSYALTFKAANGVLPDASQTFTLVVHQAPSITSAPHATFLVGHPNTFAATASGSPAPTLSELGALPLGVSFNTATGSLTGVPAATTGGVYPITFKATNGVAPDASQSFALTVNESPALTSAAGTTMTVGSAGSFSITASGFPAPTASTSLRCTSGPWAPLRSLPLAHRRRC